MCDMERDMLVAILIFTILCAVIDFIGLMVMIAIFAQIEKILRK